MKISSTKMMLLNELYTVEQINREDNSNKLAVLIRLNPYHDIFKGHFPGNPILPGVCIIQIMKEILINELDSYLVLNKIKSIRFLSFINPNVNGLINLDIEIKEMGNGNFYCDASVFSESVIFCRFKGYASYL